MTRFVPTVVDSDHLSLSATVKNVGAWASTGTHATFSAPSIEPTSAFVPELAAGQQTEITGKMTLPPIRRTVTVPVTVTVDPSNSLGESPDPNRTSSADVTLSAEVSPVTTPTTVPTRPSPVRKRSVLLVLLVLLLIAAIVAVATYALKRRLPRGVRITPFVLISSTSQWSDEGRQ